MYLWYFVIAGILLSLLIGVGFVYGKIIKKRVRRFLKSGERPKKAGSATSTQQKH